MKTDVMTQSHRRSFPLHPDGFGRVASQLVVAQRVPAGRKGRVTEHGPGLQTLSLQLLKVLLVEGDGVGVGPDTILFPGLSPGQVCCGV